MARSPLRLLVVGLVLALVAAGCAGDDGDRTAGAARGSSTIVAPATTEPTIGRSGPRPPVVDGPAVPMALDEESGVLVAIVEDQTWTLDLEAPTWAQRSPAAFDSSRWFWTRLVYAPGADLTVAVTEAGATYAYDADTDTWTQRSSIPEPGFPGVAALDARRDRIVVLAGPDGALRAWSYAVADDRWEEIVQTGQAPTDSSPLLVGYAPSIDAFVAVTGRGGGGSVPPVRTDTFTAENGTWEAVDTDTPGLSFTFGDLSSGTEMTYAPVTDRLIVFTDAVVAEYDPVERDWATFTAPDIVLDDGMAIGRLARLGSTLVYDSVNDRVLVYGGRARTADGWRLLDDLWSYDPITHDWSVLLDSTQDVEAF